MRILLLSDNRETAKAYRSAADEKGVFRLGVVKNLPQALECLFRVPFDALLSEDGAILHPAVLKRPVLWPNNLFLLLKTPLRCDRIPDALTYCFLRENDPGDVLSLIENFPKGQNRRNDTEVRISRFLQRIGVPVSLYGFDYLKEGIRLLLMQNRITDIRAVNDIYEILAEEMMVGPSVVEHAMRHAINAAWMRADPHTLESVFGYTVDANRATPSNAAFMFRAADCIAITTGEE